MSHCYQIHIGRRVHQYELMEEAGSVGAEIAHNCDGPFTPQFQSVHFWTKRVSMENPNLEIMDLLILSFQHVHWPSIVYDVYSFIGYFFFIFGFVFSGIIA